MYYMDMSENKHWLDEDIATSTKEVERCRKVYIQKAIKASKETGKSIFYYLGSKKHRIWYCFFIVPIKDEELPLIAKRFEKDFIIGVYFTKDPKYKYY